MEILEIINSLSSFDGKYKHAEVEEASGRKEEIVPHLIEMLEKIYAAPLEYVDAEKFYGQIYAVMLLGHFKEQRAHKIIIDLFSLPEDLSSQLFGGVVTENLPVILLNTCGGSFEEIKRLSLNRSAYEYCRSSALEAITFGVAAGMLKREDALSFFKEILEKRTREAPDHFYDALACCVLDLYPEELIDLIKQTYEDGFIHPGYVDFESFDEALAMGKQKCMESLHDELESRSLENVHARMSWWACFDQRNPKYFIDAGKASQKDKGYKKSKKKMAKLSKRKNRKSKKR